MNINPIGWTKNLLILSNKIKSEFTKKNSITKRDKKFKPVKNLEILNLK